MMASKRRRYDIRRLVKQRVDKRGRLLGAFETQAAALEWLRRRVLRLRAAGDAQSVHLARLLQSCSPDSPCGSGACPLCARQQRIERSSLILRFLERFDAAELRFLTLINPADQIHQGQLVQFHPEMLGNRTRRQLERIGVDKTSSFLIGGVDGDWDDGWRLYQPQIHAIIWRINDDHLSELVAKWPRADRVRVRKRIEPIDDLPRIVAYLQKSFWPSVARKNNPLRIHPHGKRRPPVSVEVEILHWLHRYGNQCQILFGIKRFGKRMQKTKRMRRR